MSLLDERWRQVGNWTPALRQELARELEPQVDAMVEDPVLQAQLRDTLALCGVITDGEFFEITPRQMLRFWLLTAVILELGGGPV